MVHLGHEQVLVKGRYKWLLLGVDRFTKFIGVQNLQSGTPVITLDIVYPVKDGAADELRYSLRSLENITHDKVVLAGNAPPWTTNVLVIGTQQNRAPTSKWANACMNTMAAVENDRVSDPFLLFNDDFYVTREVDEVQHYNAGDLRHITMGLSDRGYHYQSGALCVLTGLIEAGYSQPLSYMLHVPMIIHKEQWIRAWDLAMQARRKRPTYAWHMRTWYGNVAALRGKTIVDVKIRDVGPFALPYHAPFLSTNYYSFRQGRVGQWVRDEFAEVSIYER